jgi:hypothetical protein
VELTSRDQAEARRGGVKNILRGVEGMVYFQIEMQKVNCKIETNLGIEI